MIEVASAAEIVACISGSGNIITLISGVSTVVISANICQSPRHGITFPRLCGEVAPVGITRSVVDNHIFDNARTLIFEGLNHRSQLCFGTKRT